MIKKQKGGKRGVKLCSNHFWYNSENMRYIIVKDKAKGENRPFKKAK